jgi:hypothetical protein
MTWKLSRYWNKLAYLVADIAYAMVWDYTKKNSDILGNDSYSETTRQILTRVK